MTAARVRPGSTAEVTTLPSAQPGGMAEDARRPWRGISGAAGLVAASLLLSGCADDGTGTSTPPDTSAAEAAEQVDGSDALALIEDGATVVDVRTPQEFDTGHVDGALNIDLQSDTFLEEVRSLPSDESYVVYCATGNRSAQATALMVEEGFTELSDAGGLLDLAAAGADVTEG